MEHYPVTWVDSCQGAVVFSTVVMCCLVLRPDCLDSGLVKYFVECCLRQGHLFPGSLELYTH